jgi:hypothetical protein
MFRISMMVMITRMAQRPSTRTTNWGQSSVKRRILRVRGARVNGAMNRGSPLFGPEVAKVGMVSGLTPEAGQWVQAEDGEARMDRESTGLCLRRRVRGSPIVKLAADG